MRTRSPLGIYLDDRGISQWWVAKQLGVTRAYVSYLAGGKRKITPELAYRLGLLFSVDVATFQEVPIDDKERANGEAPVGAGAVPSHERNELMTRVPHVHTGELNAFILTRCKKCGAHAMKQKQCTECGKAFCLDCAQKTAAVPS